MVTKRNSSLCWIKASIVTIIMAHLLVITLPCNAQKPQNLHDGVHAREVRVGLYENKPKIFTSETGRPSGIFVGILEEIARRENWQITYVPGEWSNCLAALEEGRIDLTPDVAFSSERARKLDFHEEEVIESWSQVYAHKNTPVMTLSDLNGRRLAVLKGSIQHTVLERITNGFGFKVFFVETHSYEEAFALAANGSVDAVVSNHLYGDYYFQEYGLARTSIVLNSVALYFATAHGANSDLLEAIDNNLRAMKSEVGSVYYKELALWMESPPRIVVPRHLIWIICGIGGFLVLAFVVILLLRRQVIARTRNLVQVNETLRESEEKFRNLFQNHLAVKLLIEPENGNIVEANKAAEKFYGWSGQQLRRMKIQDINSLSSEQVEVEMEKVNAPKCYQCESRHRLADGSIRDVEVFSSRIDTKGKPLLHSIIHDITEHRKLEEHYRQAQKMEAVGHLAGGMAHDYNNMLSVILGYTELVMDRVDTSGPLHADLKEIFNAATRSAEITRQLLAFARKQTINPKVLDLNRIVEDMLKMLRRLIGEDIDLAWLPESNLWHVKIDPSQIEQILANLCVNARDAIAGVGKITIETHSVTFDEAYCADHAGFVPGEFVQLTATDDGCGMDKETLANIFEPFFTTKDVGRGTGLGLATIYGIVKQNNGFITAHSEPGKGTTFRIYLPRHAGDAEKIKVDPVTEIPLSNGEMVLLVEDESAIRKMGQMMLERLGYQVLTAGTPDEAMRLAGEHSGGIHLLITDVIMPGINGRDLADQLHTLCPDIKTLFMSGYTADMIAHRGVLEDGVNFIQKPFSMNDLGVKIRKILDAT
ncbi:MAG: transporter substrate-binding domain-containing protein [Candidatus Eisenbacteria bacterium]|nr:transporter substrate-binding domain-containing protein [Candidatus Eisenbacteria bacterium]